MGAGSSMRLFGMHAAVLLLVMASSASAFSTGAFSLLPRVSGRGLCSVAAPEPALAFAAAPRARALPITVMAAAKKADSDKPKRPLSAYFLFAGEKRPEVKVAQPELSNTQIVKKLGEMWRALPDAAKKPYQDSAAKAKAEYDAKYKVKVDTAPKRPLSAYMIFSNKVRPEVKAANPTAAFGAIAKIIGQKWREMPPAAKQEWIALEEKGKKEFAARGP